MVTRTCRSARTVLHGVFASVLALLAFAMCAPQLAFADETTQAINGTMTITLQDGGASGAVAGAGTSALGKASSGTATGDALMWLILGVVVLIAGAVYIFIKSRSLATNTGAHANVNTSSKKKTIIVAVVTALIACTCFGMFASKGVAFANKGTAVTNDTFSSVFGSSAVVVDNNGNVLSNNITVVNDEDEAIIVKSVEAPSALSSWNADIANKTIESGAVAEGEWYASTIPATLLEQLKNNNGYAELSFTMNVDDAKTPLDFDKFEVTVTPVEYTGGQIKPEVTVVGDYKEGTDYEVIYGENTNAGEGTVAIKGIGDYKGEKTFTFTIEPTSIESKTVTISEEGTTYTGDQLKPTVKIDGLVEGTDFEVAYGENKNAGTDAGMVTVIGKGNYTSSQTKTFDIQPASIKSKTVTISKEGTTYTGSQLKPTVTIEGLVENTDFEVAYGNNISAGTNAGSVTVSGIGNYTDSHTLNFDIQPASIDSDAIVISEEGTTYTGGQLTPKVTIEGLTEGTDFTVTYGENKAVGKDKGSVTVTGKGNYTGSQTKTFDIRQASIISKTVTISKEGTTYTGSQLKPTVTIEGLTEGIDFTVSYGDNVSAGTNAGSVTVSGIGNYTDSHIVNFDIQPASINSKTVTISKDGTTYTGSQLKPTVSIEGLVENTDFTVSYGDNVSAGTGAGSVTVTGKGNYTGTQAKSFDIARAKPAVVEPTGVTASVGQTLAEVSIPAQVAPNVPGTFAWEGDTSIKFETIGETYTGSAKFTPTDATNYEEVAGISVTLTVTEKKSVYAVYESRDNSLNFYNRVKPSSDEVASNGMSVEYKGFDTATYTLSDQVPWYSIRNQIKTVNFVDEGIQPVSTAYWFYRCDSLTLVNGLSKLDTFKTTTMRSMFYSCGNLTALSGMANWNTSEVTDMYALFRDCQSLATIDDVSKWDTSKVTNMDTLFEDCSSLTELNVSSWNVSNVTNMSYMFYDCTSLSSVGDLTEWNTKTIKVQNMGFMFYHCSSLTELNVSSWKVSSVTNMESLFEDCSSLTELNVSSWNVSSVTDMGSLFHGCSSLTELNVSSWNVSSVTDMEHMFSYCTSLSSVGDLTEWNTKTCNVENMNAMFYKCSKLTADCSGWNVGNVISHLLFSTNAKDIKEPKWPDQIATTSVASSNSLSVPANASVIAGDNASAVSTASDNTSAVAQNVDGNSTVNNEETATTEAGSTEGTNEVAGEVSSTAESDAVLQEVNCLSVFSKENSSEAEMKAVA